MWRSAWNFSAGGSHRGVTAKAVGASVGELPYDFGVAVSDIDEGDVLGAIELLDDPTQAEFLDSLHFKSATQYRLVHQGRLYDSKAVVGVAHGVATGQFWTSDDLYGGVAPGAAAWALRKLGFFIDDGPIYELTQLRVDRTHGKPAPYQYVVLLWAISRARSGMSRLVPFHDVSSDLSKVLAPFAIAKTAPDPAMPWFALRDTAWWEFQIPAGATGLTDADVRRLDLVAGLSEAVYPKAVEDTGFVKAAVDVIGRIIGDEPGLPASDGVFGAGRDHNRGRQCDTGVAGELGVG